MIPPVDKRRESRNLEQSQNLQHRPRSGDDESNSSKRNGDHQVQDKRDQSHQDKRQRDEPDTKAERRRSQAPDDERRRSGGDEDRRRGGEDERRRSGVERRGGDDERRRSGGTTDEERRRKEEKRRSAFRDKSPTKEGKSKDRKEKSGRSGKGEEVSRRGEERRPSILNTTVNPLLSEVITIYRSMNYDNTIKPNFPVTIIEQP